MKLGPHETRLDGRWLVDEKGAREDAVALRIRGLTDHYLTRIAADWSGWDVLYRDPSDGRYWERLYLESGLQGGGPPISKL